MEVLKIFRDFFSVNLKDYPNIGIDLEITKVLFCFTVGLIVTTIVVSYIRLQTNTLIKKLLRHEATEEENAKGLEKLGMKPFGAMVAFLSKGRLSKIVYYKGQKEYTYEEYTELIKSKDFKEEKIDFKTAEFYIKPDKIDEAKKIIDVPTTSVLSLVLLCILIIAVFACLMLIMPELLSFINSLIG